MKTEIAKGWGKLTSGKYGDEAVQFDWDWWAIYDRTPGRVMDRPIECLTYYRVEFGAQGAIESRLIVASDGTCKRD